MGIVSNQAKAFFDNVHNNRSIMKADDQAYNLT